MEKRARLTDAFCKAVEPPDRGNKLYRCGEVRGLALRVTAAGNRAFVFCYSSPNGPERRMTIGEYGAAWPLQAARKRAAELRQLVDRGIDPLAIKEAKRAEFCLRDLFEWYRTDALLKLSPASQKDISASWERHILPLLGANTKLSDLSRGHVQAFVNRVSETAGPYAANRAHSFLRRVLNLAVAEGLAADNVAQRAIQRNQEHPRERFLTREELESLQAAIDRHPARRSALAVRLLLLTGARRSEVLGMRWAEVDFEREVWTKPAGRTKQRRVHRVPLSKGAMAVLNELRQSALESEFVFPASGARGHLVEIKKIWKALCQNAGIGDCRIHDLRHSFASIVASDGGSLQTVGALLGHTQAQTTQRYAHLFDDTLREAAERLSLRLEGLA